MMNNYNNSNESVRFLSLSVAFAPATNRRVPAKVSRIFGGKITRASHSCSALKQILPSRDCQHFVLTSGYPKMLERALPKSSIRSIKRPDSFIRLFFWRRFVNFDSL